MPIIFVWEVSMAKPKKGFFSRLKDTAQKAYKAVKKRFSKVKKQVGTVLRRGRTSSGGG
jgi:hypothetical protein